MSYQRDWFDDVDPTGTGPGLRFACTMCGNCCTGPEGYVLFSDEEAATLAARLAIGVDEFLRDYTRETIMGRSLSEVSTPHGLDCIFLDRSREGRAVCSVYEDRPAQCRTWPFWRTVVQSRQTWERTRRTCPGIDQGTLIPPERIRILRDQVDV
jgi:uncharacterized protein